MGRLFWFSCLLNGAPAASRSYMERHFLPVGRTILAVSAPASSGATAGTVGIVPDWREGRSG